MTFFEVKTGTAFSIEGTLFVTVECNFGTRRVVLERFEGEPRPAQALREAESIYVRDGSAGLFRCVVSQLGEPFGRFRYVWFVPQAQVVEPPVVVESKEVRS